jgi:uncharacterized protein with PQ loop repeat
MKLPKDLISMVPCIITLLYVTLGFGTQILSVLERKNASDISLLMVSLGLLTFLSWTYYGAVKRRWEVAIPNGLGALFSTILLAVCVSN